MAIGDDVEIGANTTIDRGALEDTFVADGVKLDNQIMVGHNCRIGAHTAMAACVGVAGSTTIGERCTIGGAAMLSGHLTLGDDVHISGGTAVTSNILKPGRYTGVFPYAEHGEWQRNAAVIQQLAQLRRRVRSLEKRKARVRRPAHAARSFHFAGIHRKMELDIKGIMERLPHRYPMLLIDRVVEMVPGKSIVAIKNVSINEPFSRGTSRITL